MDIRKCFIGRQLWLIGFRWFNGFSVVGGKVGIFCSRSYKTKFKILSPLLKFFEYIDENQKATSDNETECRQFRVARH